MTKATEPEPFENFVVTLPVQMLPDFDLTDLKRAVIEIVEEMGGWKSLAEMRIPFDRFGSQILLACDGVDLVYDRGASDPSSPFRVWTVMLVSELG